MQSSVCSDAIRLLTVLALTGTLAGVARADEAEDHTVALSLASMLQSARQVIGDNQALINNPALGDKGLTGQVVLDAAVAHYIENGNPDPRGPLDDPRLSSLLDAQMQSIVQVMAENQDVINEEGLDFKGFVPAVFARMVNDTFGEKVGAMAQVKVTAPIGLVRNRRARPDDWETAVITQNLANPSWPKGAVFEETTQIDGREAFRVAVPEYYRAGCLTCHGQPQGEIDITGYPKEGGALGDLGGVISITLFR